MLSQRMADELMNMSLDEAMPLARALGHYLNLTSIAELHHRYTAAAQHSTAAAVATAAAAGPAAARKQQQQQDQR
jgi:phosphoenolpyruvate carboxylase